MSVIFSCVVTFFNLTFLCIVALYVRTKSKLYEISHASSKHAWEIYILSDSSTEALRTVRNGGLSSLSGKHILHILKFAVDFNFRATHRRTRAPLLAHPFPIRISTQQGPKLSGVGNEIHSPRHYSNRNT